MGYLFATGWVGEGSEEPVVHDWKENLKKRWRRLEQNSECPVADSLLLEGDAPSLM